MTNTAFPPTGLMTRSEAELREVFIRQVDQIPGGQRIKRCIQCGTCTGSCPVSYAMDISPRQLIALFRAGELETIMKSRTIWICASCYACTTRCPSGIKITDIVYALKRTAMEKRQKSDAPQVQILANIFVKNLRMYGRLHEGTLIGMYYARTGIMKLFGFIPLVRVMLRTKRLAILPGRIKARHSFARIIRKAQEIEMRHLPEPPAYLPEFVGYSGLGTMPLEQRKGE